jgi:hypothetical protein
MTAEVTVAHWHALRLAYEKHGFGLEQLASMARRKLGSLERRARMEGWKPFEKREEFAHRIMSAVQQIIGEIEDIGKDLKEGAGIDKGRVEAVSMLMKTVEKLREIANFADELTETQAKRDARMAGILDRIDTRIIELARHYAERLVAKAARP